MKILIFVRFLISVNSASEKFRSPYFLLQQFNVSTKKSISYSILKFMTYIMKPWRRKSEGREISHTEMKFKALKFLKNMSEKYVF